MVVCENDDKCNLLLDKAPRCLRKLIVIHETRLATNQRAKNRGIEVVRFEDVEKNGAIKNHPEIVRFVSRTSQLRVSQKYIIMFGLFKRIFSKPAIGYVKIYMDKINCKIIFINLNINGFKNIFFECIKLIMITPITFISKIVSY